MPKVTWDLLNLSICSKVGQNNKKTDGAILMHRPFFSWIFFIYALSN